VKTEIEEKLDVNHKSHMHWPEIEHGPVPECLSHGTAKNCSTSSSTHVMLLVEWCECKKQTDIGHSTCNEGSTIVNI
jgi:hypothetical protein